MMDPHIHNISPAQTQLETMSSMDKRKATHSVQDLHYHQRPIHHQDTATSQSSAQISYKEAAH
jgi:hypothetical protein